VGLENVCANVEDALARGRAIHGATQHQEAG
jgi:hypothetical protein